MKKDVIIIGAGAAGLMAGVAAAQNGHRVTILEKNEKAGKKIYITGKGRCNLTNDCATEDFFGYVARNHKFLYSAVYGFDHEMVKAFFEESGCPLKVERGNRVFPVSDHASDVTGALVRRLQQLGGKILCRTEVQEILTEELDPAEEERGRHMRVCGVRLRNGKEIPADAVILCTGGLSYPSTGSTGDGLRFAEDLGLAVTPTAPSLVPFETREQWCRDLQGLALKNVAVRIYPQEEAPAEETFETVEKNIDEQDSVRDGDPADAGMRSEDEDDHTAGTQKTGGKAGRKTGRTKKKRKNRPVYEAFGELLFTHFGLSGPIILTASCYCDFAQYPQGFRLLLDLKPALTQEQLQERIAREFGAAPNRHLPGAVRPLFPARLAEAVTELSGLGTERRAASFTEQEISALAALIKSVPVAVTGTRDYNEAIVTRGGISVREFDPSTMESRRVAGLFAAGEVLDVDAQTGGFNLQIAWSTGHLAGNSI
ncbi:MAG: NAD(P)/FAD-dependent oxidoreductase [Eubacteriales bacterium]|nr:NAD(P)/FAD-dependent oxidoreductase [Eubacteriales bacterium]